LPANLLGVTLIEVTEFCKSYAETVAVQRLSFTLQPGEILGLVGANGAGKTTTLRALAGIIPTSGGRLNVDGFSLLDSPIDVKQRTAYVADDPQLFSDLTVQQHLQFQASVYGISKPAAAIGELLAMFELDGKRDARASALSRGMRQKLAICCAYLQQPSALLLDEPMTGLDPQAIRVLKQSVIERAQAGAAVIISSHFLAVVEDICTHVLVLNSGQCKFFGTLLELQERYSNKSTNDTTTLEDAFFSALSAVETQLVNEVSEPGSSALSLSIATLRDHS
jgi:ABC-2 type transport system ATP-binding protein